MPRADQDVKTNVWEHLRWDDRVDAGDVRVEVADGKVTLEGTVSSLVARQAATAGALSVSGVAEVDNCLTVRYPDARMPDDEELRADAEKVLHWNPEIDASRIQVRVERGTVILEGSVDALWKQMLAEDAVTRLTGVTAVENRLATVPTADASDEIISQSVVGALKREPLVNEDAIDVKVANAVVTLSGAVPNRMIRQLVVNAALYSLGVIGVDDRLTVA